VNLYFQTNFNLAPDVFRDITFAYTVTGYVLGVDGWMGGSGTRSIAENLYADPGLTIEVGHLNLSNVGQLSGETLLSEPVSTLYVMKDITIGANGMLSEFTQSFETPEPLTFGLIGGGLLLLGLLRRRAG